MKFLKRHWPLLGLGLLLLMVGSYFIKSGSNLIRAPALLKDVISGQGLKLKDIHYTQDDPDRRMKWVLDAKEVSFSEDRKTIRFDTFALRVEPEGEQWFKLKGNRGRYDRDSGVIELWGDLEGVSADGYRILTEYVMINEQKKEMSSDQPVKIFGPFFRVDGRGFLADLKRKQVEILSGVTTEIHEGALIS
ncbi:MAG: LPS export ABC transporter periplasmic protein LptC [Desulfobacteraceae bacterium]